MQEDRSTNQTITVELAHVDAEFADCYERLIAVVCDAAKNGCRPRLESEYGDLREWILAWRGPALRSLNASLRLSSTDTHAGDETVEQVIGPPRLSDLLAGDRGDLIERVSRISEFVFARSSGR